MEIYFSVMDLVYGEDRSFGGRFASYARIISYLDENFSGEEFEIYAKAVNTAEKIIKENGFEYLAFPIMKDGKSVSDFYMHILKED